MTGTNRILARAELQIHHNLQHMADLCQSAMESAMTALKCQDADVAQQVIDGDRKLNVLMHMIEQECLTVLATLEPKARDLRETVASLQIAGEIERIGDHAKDIAKIVLEMDASLFDGPMDRIATMGDQCLQMLSQIMEAYQNLDQEMAESVAAADNELDALCREASAELVMSLVTTPDSGMHSTHLLWILYHLERVGDRVTNIAERVVFMVTGETPELG